MPLKLTVVTWNVHKCTGGIDRRYDPNRTARVLAAAEPDIVLLQEVAQEGSRYRNERQVDVLGDLLGLPHRSHFVNVRFGPRRGAYGNATLSQTQILASENIDLTLPGKKARSALHTEVRLAGPGAHTRTLHIFNLHLGLGERERREQLRRLLASRPMQAIQKRTPTIVAGDFNDIYGTLGRQLLEPQGFHGPEQPTRTFPSWAPIRALDSLYVRGDLDLIDLAGSRQRGSRTASDHLPLIARLHLRDRN